MTTLPPTPLRKISTKQFGVTIILLLLANTSVLRAQQSDQFAIDDSIKRESLAVTIYNDNLGVIRDVRRFHLSDGISEIKLRDVPSSIDPTTVKITAPKHLGDVSVSEQNYEYDLVNQAKLLEKYVDHVISVIDEKGVKLEGTLLSVESDKLTLKTSTGILMLPNLARYTIDVPSLPSGLITRPTLVWRIESTKTLRDEPLEVIYQTAGLTWHAEYIAALSDDDKSLDLSGWVSLENTSGATYPNAKLKLIAGSLHRVRPGNGKYGDLTISEDRVAANAPQFQERALFEYHIYDLQHPTTIKNAEVKQVSLLSADRVAATKHFTYHGGKSVDVTVEFQNSEANHLGIPIPMGVVRVMKRDKDGSLEFVGEDRVEHTPRDEKITLKVGEAFDLVGARTITDSRNLGSHASRESISVLLKNHKDEDVTIDIEENVGEDWDITKSSMDYEKKDASTIIFHVLVPKRGEQTVTYTIIHNY